MKFSGCKDRNHVGVDEIEFVKADELCVVVSF